MSNKGRGFEIEVCERLSLWWTDGKDDDVFWHTHGSGGRATTRAKKGKKTEGQYGDIMATKPSGNELLDIVTIECKKGYVQASIMDCLDRLPNNKEHEWESFLMQAVQSHEEAGSYAWMLIAGRNQRKEWVFFPARLRNHLESVGADFDIHTKLEASFIYKNRVFTIFGLPLWLFLRCVTPEHIHKLSEEV